MIPKPSWPDSRLDAMLYFLARGESAANSYISRKHFINKTMANNIKYVLKNPLFYDVILALTGCTKTAANLGMKRTSKNEGALGLDHASEFSELHRDFMRNREPSDLERRLFKKALLFIEKAIANFKKVCTFVS